MTTYTLVLWFALASGPSDALVPIEVKQFPSRAECLQSMGQLYEQQVKIVPKPAAYSCVKSNSIL